MLIRSTDKLSEFCAKVLQNCPESVAIDTEFSRSYNDYYPKLCLLQIAYGDICCVVDVLEEGIDLSPLREVFSNPKIFKVFHDCRQDLDALSVIFSELPSPIFDTQIAAMFCEYYDNSVGYSRLVEQFFSVRLNKLSFKRVDWSKRPLSESKVRYAIDDVVYLHKLYGILRDILIEKGRLFWFLQEMETASCDMMDNYTVLLEGMDFFSDLTEQEAVIARAVVEWREHVARTLNVNRNIIISSKGVLELTRDFLECGSEDALKRHVRETYLRRIQVSLSEIVDSNISNKPELYGKDAGDRNVLNLLTILLHSICLENGISQKLVASKRDLVRAIGHLPSDIMKGWRYEFFGHKVADFIEGRTKLVFSMNGDIQLDVSTA